MTIRTAIVCFLLFVGSGCHSMLLDVPTFGPSDSLSDRLAMIEAQRLGYGHAAPRLSEGTGASASAETLSVALPNRPSLIGDGNRANLGYETSMPPGPMTMGDTGDEMPAETSEAHVDLSNSVRPASSSGRSPPLNSFWDTVKRDVREMPGDLWRDTKLVYANPVNLVILGSTFGGAIALRETGVDSTIEHHFNVDNDLQPPHHTFKEDWRDAFGAAGNPGTHFALAGLWYLVGQQAMDDKTYEVGKTLFSALAINGVTVMIGQAATYDRSPNGEYGTMPSGHTSSSFVFASVMHRAYGHLVGAPLYGLATLVAYERVEDGEHYFSDVVMGGVLGLVVGHSVAGGRDPEIFGWKLVPWASPQGGVGVAFTKPLE
ncbi:MAG: hypothetical protein DCC65_09360 [Planctomycetota bacterium]|nr:MAG: hypothetical protein DCC65_09360 [Planctomycetota bacterium]